MRVIIKIIITASLLAFISCNNSDNSFNPIVQTEFGSPLEISGDEIFQDVLGKVSFRLIHDQIIFSTADDDMFQVYDLQENHISSFGRQGSGPGEYEYPPFFRDTPFTENGRDYLLFYDGSNNMVGVVLDITASLEEDDIVIEQEIQLPQVFSHTFVSLHRIDGEHYLGKSDDRFFQLLDGLESGWYYSPADTNVTTFSMYNLFSEPSDGGFVKPLFCPLSSLSQS